MTSQVPTTVRDRVSWLSLRELDDHGHDLTQWEVDMVESLTRQLLDGRYLSAKQVDVLDRMREDRL